MKASFCTRAYLGIRIRTGNRCVRNSIIMKRLV